MRVGLCAYPRVTGDRGDRGDSAVLPLFVWHPKHHDYFLYLIWPSPCRPAGGKGFVDSFRPVGGIAPVSHLEPFMIVLFGMRFLPQVEKLICKFSCAESESPRRIHFF